MIPLRLPTLPERMEARLADALRRHRRGKGLLSVVLPAPELHFSALPVGLEDYRYWAKPAAQCWLLGLGRAAGVETQGEGRFRALDAAFSAYRQYWEICDEDGAGAPPAALADFAFEGAGHGEQPTARLMIPSLLLRRDGERCTLIFTCDRERLPQGVLQQWRTLTGQLLPALSRQPARAQTALTRRESFPAEDAWLSLAARVLGDIRAGHLDKVVLSRRVRVHGATAFDPARIMAALARYHPACVQFAYADAARGVLLGATPERLVALRGQTVASDALAGTAWQGCEVAMCDDKNLREQQLVVNAIVRALEPLCRFLEIPARPDVLELRELRHLRSVVRGEISPQTSLLQLAEALHPTPAVGGMPRQAALEWLARHEGGRRGGYTGAVGWLEPGGDGEFSVALRCAWVQGCEADLFAGAGIVAGSDPRTELAETEAKLGAMLAALQD